MSKFGSDTQLKKTLHVLGYVLSALPVLLMLMSGTMKLIQPPMVVEGFTKSGISPMTITLIGLVELSCVVLYLVPRTAVLGAIFITGYLGGAVFVHVSAHETAWIAPFLLGVIAWGGLYLRDARIRELLPLRKKRQ
jgi:hypothetical protein